MPLDMEIIRRYCRNEQVIYSKHFIDRSRERGISLSDAESAVLTGEMIEEYPDDYPFPSCLILGVDSGYNTIHVVCAQGQDRLYMISVYRPSPEKWEADMKTRKKENPS